MTEDNRPKLIREIRLREDGNKFIEWTKWAFRAFRYAIVLSSFALAVCALAFFWTNLYGDHDLEALVVIPKWKAASNPYNVFPLRRSALGEINFLELWKPGLNRDRGFAGSIPR